MKLLSISLIFLISLTFVGCASQVDENYNRVVENATYQFATILPQLKEKGLNKGQRGDLIETLQGAEWQFRTTTPPKGLGPLHKQLNDLLIEAISRAETPTPYPDYAKTKEVLAEYVEKGYSAVDFSGFNGRTIDP